MLEKQIDMPNDWIKGFSAACDLLIADIAIDRYGIGNMCSQWTADQVGEDMKQRLVEAWNAGKTN